MTSIIYKKKVYCDTNCGIHKFLFFLYLCHGPKHFFLISFWVDNIKQPPLIQENYPHFHYSTCFFVYSSLWNTFPVHRWYTYIIMFLYKHIINLWTLWLKSVRKPRPKHRAHLSVAAVSRVHQPRLIICLQLYLRGFLRFVFRNGKNVI